MKPLLLAVIGLYLPTLGLTQSTIVKGTVVNAETHGSLSGVTIETPHEATVTDRDGVFRLKISDYPVTLSVSFVGYTPVEMTLSSAPDTLLYIPLNPAVRELDEVPVYTGYQSLPRERATGSFEVISPELFNRNVGRDILGRLDGISTGTFFDTREYNINGTREHELTIRGISTLQANNKPLIILDNFPYEGDLASINANDIEQVTLLKDAAAASIWGTRAGNGVIVITTKKAAYQQPTQISFNSNLSVATKPDLYADPVISSSDYIDVETFLFDRGFYNYMEGSAAKMPLSPVVNLLIKARDGAITQTEADAQIDALRMNDVRDDYLRYVYRNAINQQYALSVSGGGLRHHYQASVGHDREAAQLSSNGMERTTLRMQNTFKPIPKMEIQTGLYLTMQKSETFLPYAAIGYGQLQAGIRRLFPYARLADANGAPLAIEKDYRSTYTDTAGNGALLDWQFRPLEEMNNKSRSGLQNVLLNMSVDYALTDFLKASVHYQYQKSHSETHNLYPADSYHARNMVNRFSQWDGGSLVRILPEGGILQTGTNGQTVQALRGQLNVDKSWNDRHRLSALAGSEIRQNRQLGSLSMPLYGYNEHNLTYLANPDFSHSYPIYDGLSSPSYIISSSDLSQLLDRFVSFYGNASYGFKSRYMVSFSARSDASNLFGVSQNRKWSPLWSAGVSWDVTKEPFYQLQALPRLRLRMTYGYSGNIDPSVPAEAVIAHVSSHFRTGLPYAYATTPPNPNLRWEKVRTINWGVDFGNLNNRISGSVEYYLKHTTDLLSNATIDPTLGLLSSAVMNSAHTSGEGVDIQLQLIPLLQPIRWSSHLLFSYNKTIVSRYLHEPTITSYIGSGGINPIQNSVAYPLYSYQWAGLNPETGNPRGYLNGEISEDYRGIVRDTKPEDLVFHGSARPLYFGSLRNDFEWERLSLSFNIQGFFSYYLRKNSLKYDVLFSTGIGHSDFSRRWQKPGDEQRSSVPSMSYPNDSNRDSFYDKASINVIKGDHIRLQDVRLAYQLNNVAIGTYKVPSLQLYAYTSNLGVIWRANEEGIDPKYAGIPAPATYAFGFTANF